MEFKLAIDTGGTFTDLVSMDETGKMHLVKVESTRENPAESIARGLEIMSEALGISLHEFLMNCILVIHGTTVATNALIEGTYAKTGLLCNKGFRDILEIRLLYKEERYDPYYPPPEMLVPRYLRLPVEGRITIDGRVHTPLKRADLEDAVEHFKTEGVEAVSVAFLWSFANDIHEREACEFVRSNMPDAYVCMSSEVLPEYREYPRTSTTVLNACLGPIISNYVRETENLFRSLGYKKEVRYMQCNAGIASGDILREKAVIALDSGPSAGPIAGLFFGRQFGYENVITMDMGGTSLDTSLINEGIIDEVKGDDVIRYRIGIPKINVKTLGAGGGSIAWVENGIFRVGPQSAESVPGPACYGKGGVDPTVTDANVVLGYYDPDFLLNGMMKIDSRLSREAIQRKIAGVLGLDLEEAAYGIFNIVNANMVNGIREISLERGYDTRDFALVVGGGCGPAHAGIIAKDLSIPLVVIPRMASGLCAFGELVSDIKHEYCASYTTTLEKMKPDRLNAMFDELEAMGSRDLFSEGVPKESIDTLWTLYIRYVGQSWECAVSIPREKIVKEKIPEIEERFHSVHERLYSFCDDTIPCELISIKITVYGRISKTDIPGRMEEFRDPSMAIKGERAAFFKEYNGYVKVPVFDGDKLVPGNVVLGPAIVEEQTTTIVVFPGSSLRLNEKDTYAMTF